MCSPVKHEQGCEDQSIICVPFTDPRTGRTKNHSRLLCQGCGSTGLVDGRFPWGKVVTPIIFLSLFIAVVSFAVGRFA